MKNVRNESGRTLVEVLGVLLVMAVLTLGGIAGYSYLVQNYRRQSAAKDVSRLVMGIKSGELSNQYDAGKVIPAGSVVRGPKISPDGVIELIDGENSYAVVTSLGAGAFALSMQLQPGTCETIYETLKNEDFTMFMVPEYANGAAPKKWTVPGSFARAENGGSGEDAAGLGFFNNEGNTPSPVKDFSDYTASVSEYDDNDYEKGILGVRNKATKKEARDKIKELLAMCNGKRVKDGKEEDLEFGAARWVFNCAQGSSSYGYLYDLLCAGCRGYLDVNGQCCSDAASACGNLCSCPGKSVCNGSGESAVCVECVKDEDCADIYPNDFSKHICNTTLNKCVECTDLDHCGKDSGFSFKDERIESTSKWKNWEKDYKGHKFNYCDLNKCVECKTHYRAGAAASDLACPSKDEPLCDDGFCVPCTDPAVWNETSQECACPEKTPVFNPNEGKNGACVVCYDSASGKAIDRGCGSGLAKICFDTKMDCSKEENKEKCESFKKGASLLSGNQCVECLADSDCDSDGVVDYYCDHASHMCQACDKSTPYVVDGVCYACKDDAAGANKDTGCPIKTDATTEKLCVPTGGTGNNTGKGGSECKICINDKYEEGDVDSSTADSGCTDNPLCDAGKDAYGTSCKYCKNDRTDATADSGCAADPNKPLCEATQGGFGTTCRRCINDHASFLDSDKKPVHDTGCASDALPYCNAGANAYSNTCALCYNDGADTDAGQINPGCTKEAPNCMASVGEYGMKCENVPDLSGYCFDTLSGRVSSDNKARFDLGCAGDSTAPMCITGSKTNTGACNTANLSKCIAGRISEKCDEEAVAKCQETACATECDKTAEGYTDATCNTCKTSKLDSCKASNCTATACWNALTDTCRNALKSGTKLSDECIRLISMTSSCVSDAKYCAWKGQCSMGEVCAKCMDSASVRDKDMGCGSDDLTLSTANQARMTICSGVSPDMFENNAGGGIGNQCSYCVDTATGTNRDFACGTAVPICLVSGNDNSASKKPGTDCVQCLVNADCTGDLVCNSEHKCVDPDPCNACTAANKCCDRSLVKQGKDPCVTMTEYDDIYKNATTKECVCVASLGTKWFSDQQGFDYGRRDRDKDKNCSRLQSYRQRQYTVNVSFYCPRYMRVSDGMEADDFVAGSVPAGIGSTSPAVRDKTWVYAHTNTITPKVSSATIVGKNKTAKLIVQDRWLGEVGAYPGGYFYFTTSNAARGTAPSGKAPNGKHSGKDWYGVLGDVAKAWAPGSSKSGPVGGYVCKKGARSTTRKDCSNYCRNWSGPY